MDVQNHLAELRTRRGISAARLANEIGVSRQTIYAIEAGTYVPNTSVSLKLARVLEVQVEDIFHLEIENPDEFSEIEFHLLGRADETTAQPGQPVQLVRVGTEVVGVPPEPGVWSLPSSDGVLVASRPKQPPRAQVTSNHWDTPNRVLIAGCDPSASILGRALNSQGIDLLVSYQNSSDSLELLSQGLVHFAGTHLVDKASGEFDLARVRNLAGKNYVNVYAYAVWEEGIVVANGNPKNINSVADFARSGIHIVNREPGAGCRHLLDSLLRSQNIATGRVHGYTKIAYGHLPAARCIQQGEADACISTRAVARTLGLGFISLVHRPYHLVVRRKSLKLAGVQALIDMLSRTSFRREVEVATGYDMHQAGELIS